MKELITGGRRYAYYDFNERIWYGGRLGRVKLTDILINQDVVMCLCEFYQSGETISLWLEQDLLKKYNVPATSTLYNDFPELKSILEGQFDES